jgi:hypothetical protein
MRTYFDFCHLERVTAKKLESIRRNCVTVPSIFRRFNPVFNVARAEGGLVFGRSVLRISFNRYVDLNALLSFHLIALLIREFVFYS